MKIKFLSTLALAAVTFGMASCSSEEVAPVNGESTVTLSVTLPDGIQSRFGEGTTANKLTVMVLDGETPVAVLPGSTSVYNTEINLTKNIDLKLVNGKTYKVVCWAAAENSPYSFNTTNYTVTANYEGAVTSDEKLDAFFAAQDITVTGNTNETVKLYRPFAQLNIGTNDLADAKTAGFEASTVTVTVPTYKSLNLLTGEVEAGAPQSVTFDAGALPTGEAFPKPGYDYLSMNYIMMSTDKQLVDLEFTVNSTKGEERTLPLTAVPVQRNYRTNIIGSLLTNSVNVTIEVVPAFKGNNNYTPTYELLMETLNSGKSATLENDLTLKAAMNVTMPAGSQAILDLNGKTVKNTVDLWDGVTPVKYSWSLLSVRSKGTLTVTGNGKMIAKENDVYAADVQNGGHLIIENGTFTGNVSCVYVTEGIAEIKGGIFSIQKLSQQGDTRYLLNCLDGAYKNGKAKIIVTGGTFIGFNPADNAAEGEHTNFVAPGYVSMKITYKGKDAWMVVSEDDVKTVNVPTVDAEGNVTYGPAAAIVAEDQETFVNTINYSGNVLVNNDMTVAKAYIGTDGVQSNIVFANNATFKKSATELTCMTFDTKNSNISISGNGTIIGSSNYYNGEGSSAISVRSGATVNIFDGINIEAGSGSGTEKGGGNNCVVVENGTINIYGGNFHSGLAKNGTSAVILLWANNASAKSCANIYGGVFDNGDGKFLLNIQDSDKAQCKIQVYGGIFVGFNPADNDSDGAHTNYVAPGYKSVQITYNGKVAYQVVKE